MQVFFILFSVHFAVYQYINSKCLYRTHVFLVIFPQALLIFRVLRLYFFHTFFLPYSQKCTNFAAEINYFLRYEKKNIFIDVSSMC